MKLTEEKIKQLIKEEISLLSEEENFNPKVDAAQKALEAEAKTIFNKIKQTASTSELDLEMLKKSFLDSFQKQG
jgi:hypothetical protein